MKDFDFSTKDIYLASTLISIGYLYFLQKKETQFTFYFQDDETKSIDSTVDKYWNGNLICDPKKAFDSFKELKTRIFS